MLFFKKGFMEYVLFEVELEASLDDYYNHVLLFSTIFCMDNKKHPWACCLGENSCFGYIP